MTQITYFGTDGQVQSGIYGGVTPVTYEEDGTNGVGQRMTAVRQYYQDPTKAFQSADKGYFDTGHIPIVSVSNFAGVAANTPYWSQVSSGSLDSTYGAMFTRVGGWDFDANVTTQTRSITTTNGSANIGGTFTGADKNATITGTGIQSGTTIVSQTGSAAVMSKTATATGSPSASIIQGLKAPYVYFIFEHEIDRPVSPRNTWGGAAAYVLAWQHLHNLCNTNLTALGVPTSRVRWCWCVTGFGVDAGRVDPFYPGNAYVDTIGVDPYTGPGGSTSFSTLVSNCLAYARGKGKSISYPEIANIQTDSTTVQAWYADMGAKVASSDVTTEFLCQWVGSPSTEPSNWWQFNFNKLSAADSGGHANPDKHAGLITALASMGNNPIRVGVTQGLPTAPTGVAAAPAGTAGTQLTMTWAANPSGDTITAWDVFINPGVTTNLHKDNQSGSLPATPRSYTFSGLTPGTQYSVTAVAINSAGRSGYGTIIQASTSTPGVGNHAPVIDSASITPVVGTFTANYSVSAHDPDSNPLTYAWTITDNLGNVQTSAASSGTFTFPQVGTFTWSIGVSDNGTPPLTTVQTGTFAITTNQSTNTSNFNWPLPQTGSDIRTIAPILRGILPDLDGKLWATSTQQSSTNSIHGLVASSIDPAIVGASSTIQLTTNQLYWCALLLQGTTITGITTLLATPQSGTGSVVALYNSGGNMLQNDDGTPALFSGTSVDTWLQTTGPSDFTLPIPITQKLSFGQTAYVAVYNPTQATHAAFRSTASAAFVAQHGTSAQYRSAVVGSQTTCPDPLPFANQAVLGNQFLAFFGLF